MHCGCCSLTPSLGPSILTKEARGCRRTWYGLIPSFDCLASHLHSLFKEEAHKSRWAQSITWASGMEPPLQIGLSRTEGNLPRNPNLTSFCLSFLASFKQGDFTLRHVSIPRPPSLFPRQDDLSAILHVTSSWLLYWLCSGGNPKKFQPEAKMNACFSSSKRKRFRSLHDG